MPFVSQVLGRAVLDPDGSRVGTLRDLLVAVELPYPPVRVAVIGNARLQVVPWGEIASVTPRGAALRHPFDRAPTTVHATQPEAYLVRGEVRHAVRDSRF